MRAGRVLLLGSVLLLLAVLLACVPAEAARESSSADAASEALLSQIRAGGLLSDVGSTSGSGATASGASSTSSSSSSSSAVVRSIGQAIVLRSLQQHNETGTLPPLEELNIWLRKAAGSEAVQLSNSSIVFDTQADNGGAGGGGASTASTTAGTSSAFESSASSASGASVESSFASFASAFPRPSNSSLPPSPFSSSGPPAFPSFGLPGSAANGALPAPPDLMALLIGPDGNIFPPYTYTADDNELSHALRDVRYGLYQTIYAVLRLVANQLFSVRSWVVFGGAVADNAAAVAPLVAVLDAVANQLQAIAFAFLTQRGIEETEEAVVDLGMLLRTRRDKAVKEAAEVAVAAEKEQAAAAAAAVAGGADGGGVTSLAAEIQAGFDASAADRFFAASSSGGAVNSAALSSNGEASASLLVCPSFLYASWLRIETGADASAGAVPASAPSSRVLLRFTESSFERVERVDRRPGGGRTGVRHQRWGGSLRVECEWSEEEEALAAASVRKPVAVDSSSGGNSAASLLHALSLPSDSSADITVRIVPSDAAVSHPLYGDDEDSDAPLTLRFAYMPLRVGGETHAVLVEKLRSRSGVESFGRAYMRYS